ncbi:MAG: caspase family protein [Polyangiaceae bacterium]
MKTNETHVLLIGIDSYDSPSLTPLMGSRNDAIAWFRFCVDHLAISARNITVLASPPLTPRELGPEAEVSRLRGGTRAEILDEARRFADAAAGGAGLFTFSGHGLAVPPDRSGAAASDLALCPSDASITLREGDDSTITGTLRFSELAEIFRSQDCKDNITVLLDTCYASGPAGPMRKQLTQAKAAAEKKRIEASALDRARQILRVDAFTNRLFLGARHWTSAYEIQVGGKWRGAASFAMQTLMERWSVRQEEGFRYPNVSHADLMARMRSFLDVLGVPQQPALWGKGRLDEMPVLRPGLRFVPGETSPEPDGPMNARQIPTNPDKVALVTILDQNSNPIIHVISVGANVPHGVSGYNARTEYWYTNTTSAPTLTGLTYRVEETDDQRAIDDFHNGWDISITCAQLIGTSNWPTWTSGTNTTGQLFQTSDPTGNDTYMGLYLEYRTNGLLGSYAWYRITLLTDGFAYNVSSPPSSFVAKTSTDPNTMASGSWKYSAIVAAP